MNIERILALADLIEQQPKAHVNSTEGFYMNQVLHTCGTPSCIAGWAAWEAHGRPSKLRDKGYELEIDATEYLGFAVDALNDDNFQDHKLYELFYPDSEYLYYTTPQQAAKVLRHFAETGEVDWSIIDEVSDARV